MAYYGVIKPQGTWVHEHFHYALATTLGNFVNMFYREKGPYHVNRETVRALRLYIVLCVYSLESNQIKIIVQIVGISVKI